MDVLVHGEAERTDMVEFFGEKLDGFAFTAHAWVQVGGEEGRSWCPFVTFAQCSLA